MERSTVIILWILFIALGFLLVIDGAEGKTITVDDDGGADYDRIRPAIKEAEVGDTIRVWNGTYHNIIIIDKKINLIGNGTDNTFLEVGGDDNGFEIKDNGVALTGFSVISNTDEGASIQVEANNCIVYNNECSGSKYGIRLENAHHNTIENNSFKNDRIGICIKDGSDHNSFQNNLIYNYSKNGIFVDGLESKNNIIASTNEINGIQPHHYYNLKGNAEYPIVLDNFLDTTDYIDITNLGIIYIENCTNLILRNISINNSDRGIVIRNSRNIAITSTNITNAYQGILISNSKNCTIDKNLISESHLGVQMYLCGGNSITSNNLERNNIGIYIIKSDTSLIKDNKFTEQNEIGIQLDMCNYITLTSNSIGLTDGHGIRFEGGNGNSVIYNEISNNTDYGIFSDNSFFLEATHNYWGHSSGPHNSILNPRGQGDNITNDVIFEPWLDENGTMIYFLEELDNNNDDVDDGSDEQVLQYSLIFIFLALMGLASILIYSVFK